MQKSDGQSHSVSHSFSLSTIGTHWSQSQSTACTHRLTHAAAQHCHIACSPRDHQQRTGEWMPNTHFTTQQHSLFSARHACAATIATSMATKSPVDTMENSNTLSLNTHSTAAHCTEPVCTRLISCSVHMKAHTATQLEHTEHDVETNINISLTSNNKRQQTYQPTNTPLSSSHAS